MRLKWFRNRSRLTQKFIFLGLLFVILVFYLCLAEQIKPAVVSSISLPLKLSHDLVLNTKQFLSFQNLTEENSSLKVVITDLQAQLITLEEVSQENARLREQLTLPEQRRFKTAVASVIGKDSSNWTKTIMINRGSSSGIKKGMPVVVGGALVGRVTESFLNVSKVALIIDLNSKVPAKVSRSREEGVVFGALQIGRNFCSMKYVHQIEPGDKVITSGLGRVYPKGLLIGVVKTIEEEQNKLYKIARIQPAVDFSTLEEVMVITEQ